MRASTYVLGMVALAALASANAQSTGGAQNAGKPAQPNTTTQPAQPNPATQQTMPNSTNPQQTVRPPDSRNPTTNNSVNNPARVPPASRGVGSTASRPDCSKMRGLEKSECERRNTTRDDLPAGVTTTQPEK